MAKITARQRVLAYLKRHRSASADQIAKSLRMQSPAVRHHLNVLCADGRAVQATTTVRPGRGRPPKRYAIAGHLLGNNLAPLLDAALTARLARLPAEGRDRELDGFARALAGSADDLVESVAAKRLSGAIERLNGMNYQARWEAGARGPRVLFGHCPYAAVIENHPELCQMDALLLGRLSGGQVAQLAKIGAAGSLVCRFQID